jgi:hypothetical protein
MHHAKEIWFSLKDNVTYIDDSNISELKENQDTLLIVMDCLINALIILFNIFLVALILCKRNLRQKLFYCITELYQSRVRHCINLIKNSFIEAIVCIQF